MQMTFQELVAIVETHMPTDGPYGVVGAGDAPGAVVLFLLRVPSGDELQRIEAAIDPWLPLILVLDIRWSRCMKHEDCRDHPKLGRDCDASQQGSASG